MFLLERNRFAEKILDKRFAVNDPWFQDEAPNGDGWLPKCSWEERLLKVVARVTLTRQPLAEKASKTLAVFALYEANRASMSGALDKPNLLLASQGRMDALGVRGAY